MRCKNQEYEGLVAFRVNIAYEKFCGKIIILFYSLIICQCTVLLKELCCKVHVYLTAIQWKLNLIYHF